MGVWSRGRYASLSRRYASARRLFAPLLDGNLQLETPPLANDADARGAADRRLAHQAQELPPVDDIGPVEADDDVGALQARALRRGPRLRVGDDQPLGGVDPELLRHACGQRQQPHRPDGAPADLAEFTQIAHHL